MAQIDIDEICRNYFTQLKPRTELLGINYSNLSMKVHGKVLWNQTTPQTTYDGPTSIVRVHREDPSLEAYGAVHSSNDNEVVTSVEIVKGALKNLTGINKRLHLTLPDQICDQLGKSVEIDISEERSETRHSFRLQVQSGQAFPKHERTAEATVKCLNHEYQGTFSCTVGIGGNVVFQLGPNKAVAASIGDIEDHHNKSNAGSAFLRVLRKEGTPESKVVWSMNGKCKFQWVSSQVISWGKAPVV